MDEIEHIINALNSIKNQNDIIKCFLEKKEHKRCGNISKKTALSASFNIDDNYKLLNKLLKIDTSLET